MRSDPGIFNFVKWLRVGEEGPDTTLVISHSKTQRRTGPLAPEALKLLELETQVIHTDLGKTQNGCCQTQQPAEHEGVAGAAPYWGRRKDTQGGLCAVAEVEPDGVRWTTACG